MGINAVDLGFLYTKAIVNGRKVIIKSIVGDSVSQRFGEFDLGLNDKEDNIKINLGEEKYFVSDLAINQSNTILHSLDGDRFNSLATSVIVNAILGVGQAVGNDEFIVSGLPVSHFATYKDDISKLFLGNNSKTHNYDIENDGKSAKGFVKFTNGKFIPQPFGVLLDNILDEKGQIKDRVMAGKTIAVIDIGFGTTDIYVTNALSPVERLTFSLPIAMNNAYKLISSKIEEQFNVGLQFHAVETVARTKEFKSKGMIYPVEKLVEWAFKNIAEQIVTEITNKWGNSIYEVDEIILAGGGGIPLSKWILDKFSNISLTKDSQWAVVKGYHKWGVRHSQLVKA
jgi:plasmid segregation protein ParM